MLHRERSSCRREIALGTHPRNPSPRSGFALVPGTPFAVRLAIILLGSSAQDAVIRVNVSFQVKSLRLHYEQQKLRTRFTLG